MDCGQMGLGVCIGIAHHCLKVLFFTWRILPVIETASIVKVCVVLGMFAVYGMSFATNFEVLLVIHKI